MKVKLNKPTAFRSNHPKIAKFLGLDDKVVVHYYDTWSLDYTLGKIIVPGLEALLKDPGFGAPNTDNEDVPAGMKLRSSEAPPKANEWDTDEFHFARWTWIVEEMLWAFKWGVEYNHGMTEWSEEEHKRAENGRRLFAKYFHCLWT